MNAAAWAERTEKGKKEWEMDPRYPTRSQYMMEKSSEANFLNGWRARSGFRENNTYYRNDIG
jgi:hypothetical protein